MTHYGKDVNNLSLPFLKKERRRKGVRFDKMVLRIDNGWHMNINKPRGKTSLAARGNLKRFF